MKPGEVLEKVKLKDYNAIIRYLDWCDIDNLLDFANKISWEDTYVMLSEEEISRKQEIDYVANSIAAMEKGEKIHLVIISKKKIIGNAEVRQDERRRKHVGVVTIAIDKEARGCGFGARLLQHIVSESKKKGLRLLLITVFEINKAGIAAYERAGFVLYGKVPGALYYKGEYVNELYYYKTLHED